MSLRFEFDPEKLRPLLDFLIGTEDRFSDMSAPLSDVANILLAEVRHTFSTEGASIGQSWAAHAPDTERRWGGHALGILGGGLYSSLQKFVRKFVCGVSTDAPHAHLFENGTHSLVATRSGGGVIKHRHNPALGLHGSMRQPGREFMRVDDGTQDRVVEFLSEWLIGNQAA